MRSSEIWRHGGRVATTHRNQKRFAVKVLRPSSRSRQSPAALRSRGVRRQQSATPRRGCDPRRRRCRGRGRFPRRWAARRGRRRAPLAGDRSSAPSRGRPRDGAPAARHARRAHEKAPSTATSSRRTFFAREARSKSSTSGSRGFGTRPRRASRHTGSSLAHPRSWRPSRPRETRADRRARRTCGPSEHDVHAPLGELRPPRREWTADGHPGGDEAGPFPRIGVPQIRRRRSSPDIVNQALSSIRPIASPRLRCETPWWRCTSPFRSGGDACAASVAPRRGRDSARHSAGEVASSPAPRSGIPNPGAGSVRIPPRRRRSRRSGRALPAGRRRSQSRRGVRHRCDPCPKATMAASPRRRRRRFARSRRASPSPRAAARSPFPRRCSPRPPLRPPRPRPPRPRPPRPLLGSRARRSPRISPPTAAVEVNGVSVPVKGGAVHLEGALGSAHIVHLVSGLRDAVYPVIITEAAPSRGASRSRTHRRPRRRRGRDDVHPKHETPPAPPSASGSSAGFRPHPEDGMRRGGSLFLGAAALLFFAFFALAARAQPVAPGAAVSVAPGRDAKRDEALPHFGSALRTSIARSGRPLLPVSPGARALSDPRRHEKRRDLYAPREPLRRRARDVRGAPPRLPRSLRARSRARDRADRRGLTRYVGSLAITGAETGANVIVDGRERGVLPLPSPIELSVGSRLVRVSKEGFSPFERRVEIASGQASALDVRLEPLARSGAGARPRASGAPPRRR